MQLFTLIDEGTAIVRLTEERVDVADGKFTVILRSDGTAEALRHNAAWPAYAGGLWDNLAIALARGGSPLS